MEVTIVAKTDGDYELMYGNITPTWKDILVYSHTTIPESVMDQIENLSWDYKSKLNWILSKYI